MIGKNYSYHYNLITYRSPPLNNIPILKLKLQDPIMY